MEFGSDITFEQLETLYNEYNDESYSNRDLSISLISLIGAFLKSENVNISEYNLFLFVSNQGNDATAKYNSLRHKYKTITRALNDAKVEIENGAIPLVIIKDGIYREHSLLRDRVDQFYSSGVIVWTDILCRSVLSDEFQPLGVKCKVLGKGSFYHSSDKCVIPRNGLNLRRTSSVYVEASNISSISLWSTNSSKAIIKNANILFEAKTISNNKTIEFYNCVFNNSTVAYPYSSTGSKLLYNECEFILKQDPEEAVEIYKDEELILTISPDFDGDFIDVATKTAEQVIDEFVVSTSVIENSYNRYAAGIQIIMQPENMTGNELVMRECIIRLRRESTAGLVLIQKGEAPATNKSKVVIHDLTVFDETSNKDTVGLVLVKEDAEYEELDLLVYSLYTNCNVLRYEKDSWFNFEYNFKVYPEFLRNLKDAYEITIAEEETHISIYEKVENGNGYLRVLHSPDQSIGFEVELDGPDETGLILVTLTKESILLKTRKTVLIGTEKILISDPQDSDNLKYITISDLTVGSGGDINTASNLGSGSGIWASKVGADLRFRSLVEGTNITISSDSTSITISSSDTTYNHPTGFTNQPVTALSGNSVISRITVNNEGHVTGVSTRELSYDNYSNWRLQVNSAETSNVNSNDIVNFIAGTNVSITKSNNNITINSSGGIPYTHPPKTWVDKSSLAGAFVISNLTIDSLGHLTNWTTRQLTVSDIGAETAFNKGNILEGVGISITGGTGVLVGSNTTIKNNDGGSSQNIFKTIQKLGVPGEFITANSNNTTLNISATGSLTASFNNATKVLTLNVPTTASFSKGNLLGALGQIIITNGSDKLVEGNATVDLHDNVKNNIASAFGNVLTGGSLNTSTGVLTLNKQNSSTVVIGGFTISTIKVLNTTNETALATANNEVIEGSGTVNLHRISKTGNYDHLLNKPDLSGMPSSIGTWTNGTSISILGAGRPINGNVTISVNILNSFYSGATLLYTLSSIYYLKKIEATSPIVVTNDIFASHEKLIISLISGGTVGHTLVWNGSSWIAQAPASGVPSITATQVGYGNASNLLTSENKFVYIGSGVNRTLGIAASGFTDDSTGTVRIELHGSRTSVRGIGSGVWLTLSAVGTSSRLILTGSRIEVSNNSTTILSFFNATGNGGSAKINVFKGANTEETADNIADALVSYGLINYFM